MADLVQQDQNNEENLDHILWMTDQELAEKGGSFYEALKQLEFDGTPEEAAENQKDRGNKEFAKGKAFYGEAVRHYTLAIHCKSPIQNNVSIYYSNRAQVNLALGNFGRVLTDCDEALRLNPKNVKASYRAFEACFSLHRYDQAEKYLTEALLVEPQNKALLEQQKRLEQRTKKLEKQNQEQAKEVEVQTTQKQKKWRNLEDLFAKRDIKLGPALFNTQRQYEGEVSVDEEGIIHWPVMFLYEEHSQSEFVRDFRETDTFLEHLSYMFPPNQFTDWDKERKYQLENLEIYAMVGSVKPLKPLPSNRSSIKKRWIKIKPTTTLQKLTTHIDYVIPQYPVVYIVTTNSKFRNEMLKRNLEEED